MSGDGRLWVTKIEIVTDYDPTGVELEFLAREATSGDAYCTSVDTLEVEPEEALDGLTEEGLLEFFFSWCEPCERFSVFEGTCRVCKEEVR